MKTKEVDIKQDLYLCSPLLNKECSKTNCYINNGCCCHTVNKEYSQESLIEKEKELSDRIVKASRKIDKFKETYIICFDKPLWDFVKRLEKCLKSGDE